MSRSDIKIERELVRHKFRMWMTCVAMLEDYALHMKPLSITLGEFMFLRTIGSINSQFHCNFCI